MPASTLPLPCLSPLSSLSPTARWRGGPGGKQESREGRVQDHLKMKNPQAFALGQFCAAFLSASHEELRPPGILCLGILSILWGQRWKSPDPTLRWSLRVCGSNSTALLACAPVHAHIPALIQLLLAKNALFLHLYTKPYFNTYFYHYTPNSPFSESRLHLRLMQYYDLLVHKNFLHFV